MKYILSSDPNEPGIWYDRYLEYLETIKAALPSKVYTFARDEKYFMLQSAHSLHDSWLNSVEISETRNKKQPREPVVGLTIKLLGQMHDRLIVLNYERVFQYELVGSREVPGGLPDFCYGDTFHGDIVTHEVRLGNECRIVHEIAFATESSIIVECSNFTHHEEMLSVAGSSKYGL